ncbi:MAG: Nramp family divalent metal transporter [Pirellulaceae bacterium]
MTSEHAPADPSSEAADASLSTLSADRRWEGGEAPPVDPGCLPPWRVANLPAPLPFTAVNALRTVGPGAILLAAAMGGGEWIVGPTMAVTYGPTILWIATTAIIIQALFNLEAVRYTLYTGEPIITGFMRLAPGPKVWGTFYVLIGTAQLATPALAAGAATVLVAAWIGDNPTADQRLAVGVVASAIIVATALLLQAGKSIERVLERISWFMILMIFLFLVVVNVAFVSPHVWSTTIQGFLIPSALPAQIDLVLLASFAATAGSGGLGNLTISNWFRDKGFGMGKHMGGIGSMLREGHLELKPVGYVFPVTSESLARWKTWWRYAVIDQSLLWALGCFLGMLLNVNLVMAIIPPQETLSGYAAGTYQAKYMASELWSGFWWLALLNGFWILYSTHLGNTDCLVRTLVDTLWSSSPRWQRWPASRLYATILGLLTVWALVVVHFGSVLDLFKVLAVIANPIMAIGAVQILIVNRRFLPVELRPPLWRQLALVVAAIVYGGITLVLLYVEVPKWFS